MKAPALGALLALIASCGGASSSRGPQQPTAPQPRAPDLRMACGPAEMFVEPGGDVELTAWVAGEDASGRIHDWHSVSGVFEGSGPRVRWAPNGAVGNQQIAVRVTQGVRTGQCTLSVFALAPTAAIEPGRGTGRDLLEPGQEEADDYGLYSYLLLRKASTPQSRLRQQRAVDAFLRFPSAMRMREFFGPQQINATYVPLTNLALPQDETKQASWILDNYDYERAYALWLQVTTAEHEGPCFVSSQTRLMTKGVPPAGPYLWMDLSWVPAETTGFWANEFMYQSQQKRYSNARSGRRLLLGIRSSIAIVAQAVPAVRAAVSDWISIAESKGPSTGEQPKPE